MPFPLGRIYTNTIRGAGEGTFIGKVAGSHIATSVFVIFIIAITILIVFYPYIVSQNNWARYLIALGIITGIIMFLGGVATYMYQREKRSLFKGNMDKIMESLSKYDNSYPDIKPDINVNTTIPESMKIAGQPAHSYVPSTIQSTQPQIIANTQQMSPAPVNEPSLQSNIQSVNPPISYTPTQMPQQPQVVERLHYAMPQTNTAPNLNMGGNEQYGQRINPELPHCQAPISQTGLP